MIKRFFKTIWEDDIFILIRLLIFMVGWLPALIVLMDWIFNIQAPLGNLIVGAMFVGPYIQFLILRCIETIQYLKRKRCGFFAAWKATK